MKQQPDTVVVNTLNPACHEPEKQWPSQIADEWRNGFDNARCAITLWPNYTQTPLHELPALAAALGLSNVLCKDESARFGLKSFKALGAAYAVLRLLQREFSRDQGLDEPIAVKDLLDGRWREAASKLTVTCATAGNHGRSLAWGAQLFGCQCVIFVHPGASEARKAAMEALGARVEVVDGNYDDAIRHAAAQAAEHGWHVVSDTSYGDYRQIPQDVMHGYGVLMSEVFEQLQQCTANPVTHVFVQAGVGGLAAAVCMASWLHWGVARPRFVVVEPATADCVAQSLQKGEPVAVTGELDTLMAGLACGEVSQLAWDVLKAGTFAALTVPESWIPKAMRTLANPQGDDAHIVAGETGASALAGLMAACADEDIRTSLGLNKESTVLVINTEGDTDEALYRQLLESDDT